ncbi:hypothetical protein P3T21_007478 [Paraburkholderia sp. GAS334]
MTAGWPTLFLGQPPRGRSQGTPERAPVGLSYGPSMHESGKAGYGCAVNRV